jgi:two-component system nitrate/nitrite sensor histidine kinase NarX
LTERFEDFVSLEQPGVLLFGGARMALLDIEAGFWGIRRQIEPLLGTSLTNAVLQQAGVNGGASFAQSFTPTIHQSDAEAFLTCLQVYQTAGFGQFEITSLEWPIGKIRIQGDQTVEAWMTTQNDRHSVVPCCAYTAGVLVGFVNIISGRKDVVCIEHTCQGKGDAFCQFELLSAEEAQDQSVVSFSPDPGLTRQLNLLEILFERMPMGVAVLDRQFRIQRYNPTWADFSQRYAPPNSAPLVPGVNYFDHLPGTESTVLPQFERVLAGETIRQNELKLETGEMVTYWDIVLAPLIEEGKVNGILNVSVDATERVEAHQNLEQRVRERTRELRTLLQVSQDINATLEIENLLDIILDQLKTVVDYSGASILTLEGEDLVMRVYRGPIPMEEALQIRFPIAEAMANHEVIQKQKPLIISDIRGDTSAARMFQHTAGDNLETTYSYIRSWLGVPLMVKGKMLGMLTLDHSQPDFFSIQHADLVMAFANHAAVAIENASLYEAAEKTAVTAERNRLARDLHDAVTQTLFSASVIADVLPKIWERNPEEGHRRLEELRQLTRGALSEMRTLLVELRPAALIDTKINDLIRHQINAFKARTRLSVNYQHHCIDDPPPEVKEVFYRITQEAFNNIAKHADAAMVTVDLNCQSGAVSLIIQDDGIGVDLESAKTEGFGLNIMEERAKNINARFSIQSQYQKGTRLQINWEAQNNEEENHER